MTCNTWDVTCDIWHVTGDSWHMTYDTWHMTHGVSRTFPQNFSYLYFTGLGVMMYLKIWWKKMNHWMNQLMKHEDVCRTAPATLGLLNCQTASRCGKYQRVGRTFVHPIRLANSHEAVLSLHIGIGAIFSRELSLHVDRKCSLCHSNILAPYYDLKIDTFW